MTPLGGFRFDVCVPQVALSDCRGAIDAAVHALALCDPASLRSVNLSRSKQTRHLNKACGTSLCITSGRRMDGKGVAQEERLSSSPQSTPSRRLLWFSFFFSKDVHIISFSLFTSVVVE
jgi:hypothetical protein